MFTRSLYCIYMTNLSATIEMNGWMDGWMFAGRGGEILKRCHKARSWSGWRWAPPFIGARNTDCI